MKHFEQQFLLTVRCNYCKWAEATRTITPAQKPICSICFEKAQINVKNYKKCTAFRVR